MPYGVNLSEMLKRTKDVSLKIVPMNVYCDLILVYFKVFLMVKDADGCFLRVYYDERRLHIR